MHIITQHVHEIVSQIINGYKSESIIDMGGTGKMHEFTLGHVTNANIKNGIDATNLPFEDNSFDVACSVAVLEHVDEQEKFIKESIRVARKGVVHWFPIKSEASDAVENFKKKHGHKHLCKLPTEYMVGAFPQLLIEDCVTCETHLLLLCSISPKLNNKELYKLIREYGSASYGALLYSDL